MIGPAIRALILTDDDVAFLLGSDAEKRVRAGWRNPRLTGSQITYQRISGEREHSTEGPVGLAGPRYQVTCWADTYSTAESLANSVRLAVDGFRGTSADTVIDMIFVEDVADIPGTDPEQEQVTIYGIRLDIVVQHRESKPNRKD